MTEQDKTEPPQQREPSKEEVAAMIAAQLGETEAGPRHAIFQIVKAAGRTHAKELLAKTLEVEANGGMMVPDGSRRRTPGGVFFYLAYTVGKAKDGSPLKRPYNPSQKAKKPIAQAETTEAPQKATESIPVFTWNDRIEAVKEVEKEKGNATTVKMTLVGRPGQIIDKGQFIMTVMESTRIPALPKGLPTPTNEATKYAVYISAKQWKKVAESIADPEDVLIVEGFPKMDPEAKAISVFTTNITTKKLQASKRQAEQTN